MLSTSTVLTRPSAVFFQDLRSSHGLNEEMKRLAKSIVQQVVLKYNSHDVYSISSSSRNGTKGRFMENKARGLLVVGSPCVVKNDVNHSYGASAIPNEIRSLYRSTMVLSVG